MRRYRCFIYLVKSTPPKKIHAINSKSRLPSHDPATCNSPDTCAHTCTHTYFRQKRARREEKKRRSLSRRGSEKLWLLSRLFICRWSFCSPRRPPQSRAAEIAAVAAPSTALRVPLLRARASPPPWRVPTPFTTPTRRTPLPLRRRRRWRWVAGGV